MSKIPSQMTFTRLSNAAVDMDTLVTQDSAGKVGPAAVGDDFLGVALSGCGAAGAEVSVDAGPSVANLTILGTCAINDVLQGAASGQVKKFIGTGSLTVTVDNTTDIWTSVGHGLTTGEAVRLTNSGGGLPANASATTTYYVSKIDADTFKLYDTRAHALAGGATGLLDVSGNGTGTQTLRLYGDVYIVGKALDAGGTTGQKIGVLVKPQHLILP